MAHNINFNQQTGKHSFVSVKELAWHKLGQVVEKLDTSEEVIKQAQLDYEVGIMEVYGKYDEDTQKRLSKRGDIVPNTFATYRKDNGVIFGSVGSRYTVIQNIEAFSFFDEMISKKYAFYETAGALGKGETVFITAKLNNYIKVKVKGKDDNVDLYMFLSLSHDGSMAITAGLTPVRIVCNNTLNAALRQTHSKTTIRHTASASVNLKEATRVLNLMVDTPDVTNDLFNTISNITISDEEFYSILYRVLLSDGQKVQLQEDNELSTRAVNILKGVNSYYFNDNTQKEIVGTGWGVYNAVTGYFQHIAKRDDSAVLKDIISGNELGLKVLQEINSNNYSFESKIGRNIKALL